MAIREQKIFAMNIVAELLVEDIAEETGRPVEEVLLDFMQSEMAEKLYDDSLKLWWDGPDAFRERYKKEFAAINCGEAR
jgi:hypothetical protein